MTGTDVKEHVQAIMAQETAGEKIPLALRLSGHLLVGVVRIFSRQVGYLYSDANDAVIKIRKAFRSTAVADVDLPEGQQMAKESAITLRAQDNDEFSLQDVDVEFGDFMDIEAPLASQNIAEPGDITMVDAPAAMEHALNSLAQGGYDDNLPGAGGDWEVEVGRAGSIDQAEPVVFDNYEDDGGAGPMEVEQEGGYFADSPAKAGGMGAGLMDVSLEGGRISMVPLEESIEIVKPKASRKRKAGARKSKADRETQLSKNELMRRVQGGEDAVADIYRETAFVEPAKVAKRESLDMAGELADLMRQPFESYEASESEERFVELPPSQPDSQAPPPIQFDESVHDDFGAAGEDYGDYGGMGEEGVQPMDMDDNNQPQEHLSVDGQAQQEGEVQQPEGPLQSKRSQLFHGFLQRKFEESEVLSFNELVEGKSRLAVAGSFYELLLFKTHDIVGLSQEAPYADISIHKVPQRVMLSTSE